MLSGQVKSCGSLQELSGEYKASVLSIAGRIKAIKSLIKENTSGDPHKDPEVINLKERLKALNLIYSDLKEVAKEVEHYYSRSHWRNEKLTMNAKPVRKKYYCHLIYD